jgi:hypothetical protein
MKYLWLLFVFFIIINIHCKKDDPVLPAITNNGADTFGCKIDGEIFTPKGSFFGPEIISTTYSPNGNALQINVRNKNKAVLKTVNIYIDGLEIKAGTTYKISNVGTTNAASAYYSLDLDEYDVTAPLTGELAISKFDIAGHVVSGTFNFEAVNAEGKKVRVTDGRFDLKLH